MFIVSDEYTAVLSRMEKRKLNLELVSRSKRILPIVIVIV